MRTATFWAAALCSSDRARSLGGICRLDLQDLMISQARNQKTQAARWANLIFDNKDGGHMFLRKWRRYNSQDLAVRSQIRENLISWISVRYETLQRTSDLERFFGRIWETENYIKLINGNVESVSMTMLNETSSNGIRSD
jgi:hypothetical protein